MKSIVELTASARRHAEAKGLLEALSKLGLDTSLMRGDIIEFAGPTSIETFIVHARRLRIAADGSQQLVFELDYPVRTHS